MAGWDKKKDIMIRYDVTAQMYDTRYTQEQSAKIEVALEQVNVKGQNVLDVGCGTGLLFNYVANKSQVTVGLDISKKTLLIAKERMKKQQNIHVILADADNMPIKDKIFDRVFAITFLQNMPNQAESLREIKRVVKDDAMIVVTGLKKVFTKSKLQHLLKNTGFKVLNVRSENLQCHVAVCIFVRNSMQAI